MVAIKDRQFVDREFPCVFTPNDEGFTFTYTDLEEGTFTFAGVRIREGYYKILPLIERCQIVAHLVDVVTYHRYDPRRLSGEFRRSYLGDKVEGYWIIQFPPVT